MGLCQTGIGLGFIAVPHLVQAMLENYGFRGTMLLLGGIALNSVVGALLYQPVEWHMVRLRLHKNLTKQEDEGNNMVYKYGNERKETLTFKQTLLERRPHGKEKYQNKDNTKI